MNGREGGPDLEGAENHSQGEVRKVSGFSPPWLPGGLLLSHCTGVPGPNASPVLIQLFPSLGPLVHGESPIRKGQQRSKLNSERFPLEILVFGTTELACSPPPPLYPKARQCPLPRESPLDFRKGSQQPRADGAPRDYGDRRALRRLPVGSFKTPQLAQE